MKKVQMMRVRTTKIDVPVEVTLPSYQKQDMMPDDYDSISYERTAEDGSGVEIHVRTYPRGLGRSGKKEIEISFRPQSNPLIDGEEHLFGVSRSSREEFRAVLLDVKTIIDKLIADVDAEDDGAPPRS